MMTLRPGALLYLGNDNLLGVWIQARGQRILMGRNPGNHVVLELPQVEPLQCKIYRKENSVVIRNYSQRNPILLNGTRLYGERRLGNGDMIIVSAFTFRWHFDIPPGMKVHWIPDDDKCDLPLERFKTYLTCDAIGNVLVRYRGTGQPSAFIVKRGCEYEDEMMDEEALIRLMAETERRLKEQDERLVLPIDGLKQASQKDSAHAVVLFDGTVLKQEPVSEPDEDNALDGETDVGYDEIGEDLGQQGVRASKVEFMDHDLPWTQFSLADDVDCAEPSFENDFGFVDDCDVMKEEKQEVEYDAEYNTVFLEHSGKHYTQPVEHAKFDEEEDSDEGESPIELQGAVLLRQSVEQQPSIDQQGEDDILSLGLLPATVKEEESNMIELGEYIIQE